MQSLELLTSAQAADRLGVSQRYVSKLVKQGVIDPLHKNPGRTGAYMFKAEEVEALKALRDLQKAGKHRS